MDKSGRGEIVSVLLGLEREQATGALDFRSQGVLTRVFVDKGTPVFAEAGVLGETLGNVLMRERIITSGEFRIVVRKMTDAIVEDENVRFGEVACELGILTKDSLETALATQVEKKIIGCVARGEGEWSLDPTHHMEVARHQAPIRTLLVDAAKILPQDRVDAVLELNRDTYPRLTDGAPKAAHDYGLEKDEVALLARLDGTHTTKSFVDSGREAEALLAALVLGASAELLPEAQKKVVLPPPNPITVTGRRRAFHARLVASQKKEAPEKPVVRDVEVRVSIRPPAPTERQSTVFAEDEFQSGRKLFLSGKMEEAHAKLDLALTHSPQTPLYRLYEELVASRLAGKFADAAVTKKRAVQMVKEDAECAFGFYVLAYLALEEGAREQAKRFFNHAFKLDHELVDAGRQARLLDMRKDAKLTVPTPVKQIVPRPVAGAAKAAPSNTRTLILAGALAAVIVLAVVVVTLLH